MLRIRKITLAALLPVLLQACAVQHQQVNSLGEELERSTPETTLLYLQSINPPERDRAQYLLNTGLLKSISGDFEGADRDLQSAKKILNSLQATSVSENLGAAMVNEISPPSEVPTMAARRIPRSSSRRQVSASQP